MNLQFCSSTYWVADLTFVNPIRFVNVFCNCPAGQEFRPPLARSGDAIHLQSESKPGNSLQLRWIETEQHQVSRDCFHTPQDILTTESLNQRQHFGADRWPACFAPGFPAPPLQKGILPPLKNRLGFHQCCDKLPSTQHSGEQNPGQPESWMEPRPGLLLYHYKPLNY